ncbi:MAG: 4Fe-4S dicluster domain-containing protein [Candidatus Heimdallarchaeota archaeon]
MELKGEEVETILRKLYVCYQCGTCTAGCPVARVIAEFNPRQMILRLKQRDFAILDDFKAWYCAACHTCSEHCPQNIKFSEVLMELKNYLAKQGEIPPGTLTVYKDLGNVGIISEFTQAIARRRAALKLPEVQVDAKTLNEISTLTVLTGWHDIIHPAEVQVTNPKKSED